MNVSHFLRITKGKHNVKKYIFMIQGFLFFSFFFFNRKNFVFKRGQQMQILPKIDLGKIHEVEQSIYITSHHFVTLSDVHYRFIPTQITHSEIDIITTCN